MSQRLKIAVITLILFCLVLTAQVQVEKMRAHERVRDYIYLVPNLKALKVISMEFRSLMADLLWIRSIQYFGGWYSQMGKQPKGFIHLIDAITYLDPGFIGAYQFGSFGIAEGLGNYGAAVDLLVRGAEANPDHEEAWRLMYDAGFIRFYNEKKNDEAKELMMRAAQFPNAQDFVERTTFYIDSVSGRRELAIQKYGNLHKTSENEAVKAIAWNHLVRLYREVMVEQLTAVVERFKTTEGRKPENLKELVARGYLKEIPADPGESYYVYLPVTDVVSVQEKLIEGRKSLLGVLKNDVNHFRKMKGRLPESLEELFEGRDIPPEDIADPGGGTLKYDPETGDITIVEKPE